MNMTKSDSMLRFAGKQNVADEERMISAGLGVLLALFGLWKRSLVGTGLAAGGLYLVYRAVTGHCFAYDVMDERRGTKADQLPADVPPPPSVEEGDEVIESSWESFPTSDSPAWTMGKRDNG